MGSPDYIEIAIIIAAILIALVFIVRMSSKGFRDLGGGATNVAAGATFDLLNEEKRKALEIVLEQKAKKKMEEQSSDEPR